MKRGNKIFLSGIVLFMAVPFLLFILGKQADVNKRTKEGFVQKTQRLQMPFIANEHQMNESVAFFTNTFGGSVFVTIDGEVVYSLPGTHEEIKAKDITVGNGGFGREGMNHNISPPTSHTHDISRAKQGMIAGFSEQKWSKKLVIKESFIGGKVGKIQGEGKTVTNVSYFKGKDPSRWKSNISTYEVVNLGEVYKGIELKLRAYGNNIEKFFYVKPDVDPELIKIKLSGAKALNVNKEGQLEAETELGTVTFTKPVAHQEIHGKRVDVDVSYLISDCGSRNLDCENNQNQRSAFSNSINPKSEIHNRSTERSRRSAQSVYGFKVASYDRTKELVIDPLLASTYLGGIDSDYGYSIARDADKNIIVAGYTQSSDFPTTTGVYDVSYSDADIFVSKLDGDLTRLIASTYLGGSSDDYAHSIVLDPNGISLYVTGRTLSSNFPTTPGAYNTTFHNGDAFIAKINWNFTHILASTYLGGTNNDYGTSIVLDSDKNIYVSGETWSSDFPTSMDAYDTSFNGGFGDVFVSKVDRELTRLLASTYLGGTTDDSAHSMTLDSRGNIYVTGQTESSDFPTTPGAYDTSFHNGDVFVSKFSRNLTSLLASTYLGGADDDVGNSLAIGSDGKIYVAGYTGSSDFPTTSGSYNTSKGVFFDAFVSKLSSDLTSLIASTYLGGYYRDIARSIAIDSGGNIYVAGETRSSNFPTTPGSYDTSYNGDVSISYAYDAFVSKLDSNLSAALLTNKKQ